MRASILLPLALIVALSPAQGWLAAQEPGPPVTSLEADLVELDLAGEATTATGQARLRSADVVLEASQFTADHRSGELEAIGPLSLSAGGRRLRGERLHYNLRTAAGSLSQARVEEQGLILGGRLIELSPERVVAHQAYFTTCANQPPHYELTADTISLTAGARAQSGGGRTGRLSLKHVRVVHHGHTIFSLPSYSVPVGEIGRPENSPLPRSGFDREDGPYASLSYRNGEQEGDDGLRLMCRFTAFRGLRAAADLKRTQGPFVFGLSYVRREVQTDRELRPTDFTVAPGNVMLNRTPELRIAYRAPGLGNGAELQAELLHGSYSETAPFSAEIRARARRTAVTTLLTTPPRQLGLGLTLSHSLGWRRASYSSGEDLRILLLANTLSYAPNRTVTLSLSHVRRRAGGRTPFLFDDPRQGTELHGELNLWVRPRWRLDITDAYSLSEGRSRDLVISLTHRKHCLDYTLGWRQTRGSFFISVAIVPPQ